MDGKFFVRTKINNIYRNIIICEDEIQNYSMKWFLKKGKFIFFPFSNNENSMSHSNSIRGT